MLKRKNFGKHRKDERILFVAVTYAQIHRDFKSVII